MKALFKKQFSVVVLPAAVFLLVAALVILAEYTSDAVRAHYRDESTTESDYEADNSSRNDIHSIDSKRVLVSAKAIGKEVKSETEIEKLTLANDLKTANGLAMELRRIVRAGRSMEALRNSHNKTLERRCYDGMHKLQREARAIKARRRNLAVPTQSFSLDQVFSNILKCVSCEGDAMMACDLAQKDLDMVVRSLSMD